MKGNKEICQLGVSVEETLGLINKRIAEIWESFPEEGFISHREYIEAMNAHTVRYQTLRAAYIALDALYDEECATV